MNKQPAESEETGRRTESNRYSILCVSVLVSVAAAAILVATADDYGLTFDEPVYIASADRLGQWFARLFSGQFQNSFDAEQLEMSWVFARPENRNLPVPVLLSCVGHQVSGRWLPPLISYRLGHCLLIAATLGVMFAWLVRQEGWAVAAVAVSSLFLMPRVFAHAHLNATDIPVSCFWLLTILAWLSSESSWRGGLLAAVCCGLGLATKATFVLLPALLGLWMVVFRRWSWWRSGLVVLVMAPLIMLALCPMWWSAPFSRSADYFRSVFLAEPIWKIEVYYLGETYIGGLPWHNAIVLPAVTTPPWTLLLVLVGTITWFKYRLPKTGLWLMGAGILPALRLLPGTPAHDGIRLMLPSIFCFAPLAGLGYRSFAQWISLGVSDRVRPLLHWIGVAILFATGTATVARMHPHEMSYYSEGIGGLAGAAKLGFEVSYWFEAMSPEVLDEIQRLIPVGSRVWTFPDYPGPPLLRQWGYWRADLVDGDIGRADYLILYAKKNRFHAIPGIDRTYNSGRPIWSLNHAGVQIIGLYKL